MDGRYPPGMQQTTTGRPSMPTGLVLAFVAAVVLLLLVVGDLVLVLVRESNWVYVAVLAVATAVAVAVAGALMQALRNRRW